MAYGMLVGLTEMLRYEWNGETALFIGNDASRSYDALSGLVSFALCSRHLVAYGGLVYGQSGICGRFALHYYAVAKV